VEPLPDESSSSPSPRASLPESSPPPVGGGEGDADGGGDGDAAVMGGVRMASAVIPTTPALLRAACKALALENMPVESASTMLAACAAGTATSAVMMTEPGLMSRLTAETATPASLAMAVLIPACVARS